MPDANALLHELNTELKAFIDKTGGEVKSLASRVDAIEVGGLIKKLVDQRHRADAILALAEGLARLLVFHQAGLHAEEARHHLQIVLHAVMQLTQQYRL